jgi:hypothetical protein
MKNTLYTGTKFKSWSLGGYEHDSRKRAPMFHYLKSMQLSKAAYTPNIRKKGLSKLRNRTP